VEIRGVRAADGPELARGVSLALLPVPLVRQLVAQVAVYLALGGRTGRNASTTVVFYDGATAASIVAAYIVLIVTSFWIASRAGPVRQVLRLEQSVSDLARRLCDLIGWTAGDPGHPARRRIQTTG